MNKIFFTAVLCAAFVSAVNAQEWQTDFEEAKQRASAGNQKILLVFSGSDWCVPCIKLEKEIWQSEAFKAYSSKNLVLLRADFPKKKANKLSKEQEEKNDLLAEKFNPDGYFPFVVILDKNGTVLGNTGYKNVSPKEYISILENIAPTAHHTPPPKEVFHRTLLLMGSRFDITVVAQDQNTADKYIDMAVAEISRIEKLISSWDENTQTSEINRNAGVKPVKVDAELFGLIERSMAISKLTDGAFDITYAAMDKIWRFDGSMTEMPTAEAIKKSVEKVGFEHIALDKEAQTVFLPKAGMKIGFGAIGKGYAADKAKELLVSEGVEAGIINASGDMNTWGKQPNGDDWKVAITNPFDKDKAFALLPLQSGAVVTSGNYEKYVLFDGIRYAHIINPKTGYPAQGVVSVTVFAPQAELADALATAVFVMGKEVGINRINQLPNVECILIDDEGKVHTSENININEN